MTQKRSAQEERLLLSRACSGDAQAMETLLASYQQLLLSLARRFICAGGACTPGELVQAGYIGLMQAARHYDAQKAVRFITYAVPWALGEMRRAMRQSLDATGVYEKRREIARREAELSGRLGRSPRLDELAHACGMTQADLACAIEAGAPALSVEEEDDGKRPVEELLRSREGIDMEAIDLRMALERLTQEEQRLICLRFFRDKTQQETACLLGKSQTQVCRMERRALDRLREMLA